jgi:hypothetical protein
MEEEDVHEWIWETVFIPGDEDLSIEYDGSTCLSWKEILSLTNNYDKVNSFLIEENVFVVTQHTTACVVCKSLT